MKKIMIYLYIVVFALISCTNNDYFKDGSVDLTDGYQIEEEVTNKVYTLNHPCLLHTNADFDFVAGKIQEGSQPWVGAWTYLKANMYTQINESWTTSAPVELYRTSTGGNFGSAREPGLAAYYLALRWIIGERLGETDVTKYADKAVKILDNWATVCESIRVADTNDHYALITGFDGYRFIQAAELMRTYSAWQTNGGFEKFQTWLKKIVGEPAQYFMSAKDDPYWSWGGWELPNIGTIFGIGVVCDDQEMINYAINFFKSGPSSACIANLVVALHKDPAGLGEGYCLGQADESGRDQPHAGLSVVTLAPFCQGAYNIGEDLFAIKANDVYKDVAGEVHNRYPKYAEFGDVNLPLAFFEYYAKYNVDDNTVSIDMPFTYWETRHGNQHVVSDNGRGKYYPGYELLYAHYAKVKGLKAPYCKKFAEKYRPANSTWPYEYDNDFLGMGTLMFYKGE